MAAIPSAEVVEILAADAETEKRAAWEAFEFTLLEDGEVEVANGSYKNPEDHTYTVHVEGGIPAYCNCPAWDYQEGPCKHMVAVAIREPILEAVTVESRMKADGGVTVDADESDHSDKRPDDCDCSSLFKGLPCWPCYRDGFKKPNPNIGEDA